MRVWFAEEHLRAFSRASLDFNPLHLSESYARKSASGERLVYGMLAFLTCLGKLDPPPGGARVASVRVDFTNPQFLDVEYSLVVHRHDVRSIRAALMDGARTLVQIRMELCPGVAAVAEFPETGTAPLAECRRMQVADFRSGARFAGSYSPGRREYLELLEVLGVDRGRWGDALPLAALCTSYVTGMELPGESAAFAGMRAEFPECAPRLPCKFEIRLEEYDKRYRRLESRFSLGAAEGVIARGELTAFSRPEVGRAREPKRYALPGPFAGKTAVVIGASRGLGAALALDLAAQGCSVVGVYSRSEEEAAAVAEAARALPGRVTMERGDASDPARCAEFSARVEADYGRVDLVVCNAAPAPQPLKVETACCERILRYVQSGLALVAAPLSAFLPPLSRSGGRAVLISSSALDQPPPMWPHYVALKSAAEGLMSTAAVDYPKVSFWVARPGRLLTDMMNTPQGRIDAEDPATAAHRILAEVGMAAGTGKVSFCR